MTTIYYEKLLYVNFSHDFIAEKAPEATEPVAPAGPAHPAPVKSGLRSQSGTPRQKPTTSSGLPWNSIIYPLTQRKLMKVGK